MRQPRNETPVLLSVNVGMPKNVPWHGKTVHTGVWKHAVDGPQMVRRLNIDGDGQGDLKGHGGEQRAVLVYQIDSYRHWQRYFGRDDFSYGQFGENLTVDGMPDAQVCIGDRYRIGEAEFEVTQPRVTCYRVGLRLGEPELPALLVGHHRPGFYMRVIREGHIQAGDLIVKTRTGPHALSVTDADALLYLPGRDPAKLRLATRIPALSPGWQESFRDLVASEDSSSAVADTGHPAWAGFRPLRVTDVVPEATAVSSIYLTDPDGSQLPAARAGQYLTLRVPGAGQPAPVRSYSLSSAPGASPYRISVKHEPHGAASGYLTSSLHSGAILDAAAPRGDFVLADGAGPVLLISAGIGVTPVLSMLHELAARQSGRDIWWLHGARGPREHALAAEAHALLASLPHAREHIFYSSATPAERHRAHAAAGHLTEHAVNALAVPANASAYICRAGLVHGRHARSADDARHPPGPDPNRDVRCVGIGQPWTHRGGPAPAAPAALASRNRADGDLRPQRHSRAVRGRTGQPARPRRRLRRPHPLELPHRRLPHLRDAAAQRRRRLLA